MSLKGTPYWDMAIDAGATSDDEREQMAQGFQYAEWELLPLSEKMRSDIAMASVYADEVAALEAELEAWTEKGALFVEQGAEVERLREALELMLASPKDRLEYCKANDLLPSIITATESVDPYWREAIAKEALAQPVSETTK